MTGWSWCGKILTASLIAGLMLVHTASARAQEATSSGAQTAPEALVRSFLTRQVASRKEIDTFLDPSKHRWAMYDPELGYVLNTSSALRDGMNGAMSFYTVGAFGERRMINGADKRCRINTYGNSFTECHQVSDGETWQEYLAAHLREPVRNFGVGGFGVYQACRRMLREETTAHGAEYIMLNIWEDDHRRSLMGCRLLFIGGFGSPWGQAPMFCSNPWVHLRLNPDTGQFQERESACSTPESLYKLCDKEFLYKTFRDDFMVQMEVAQQHGVFSQPEQVKKLCRLMQVQGDLTDPKECRRIAFELREKVAYASTFFVLDKATEFCRKHNKKLMVLLSYGEGAVKAACEGKPRFDQAFVDALRKKGIPFVDSIEKNVEEFRTFRLSPEEYVGRYYIGHYNPKGNYFFAFAIKDAVVRWLDPKPPAYRQSGRDPSTLDDTTEGDVSPRKYRSVE